MRASSLPTSTVLVIAAAGLLVGLAAAPVLAGVTAPQRVAQPAPGIDGVIPEHTIAVGGSGKVSVVPDMATVSLGVLVQERTAKGARETAATRMTKVVAALKALGIADKDIATSTVSLNPVYDYASTMQKITGYQLTNMVTVTVRDLEVVSAVVDDAVLAGATAVNGISFDVADRSAAEANARIAAMTDAKAKADALAGAAGVSITGVATIAESVSTPVWYSPEMGLAEGAARDATTPILAGSQDITITVSVTYLID
ncbi:MAG TPA: SIMPL domain-containing protein [Candidatus Limnocylindrales bacterium]|nr:SIMPL domain-containing protein [Candidatus Limnocylindrales bacterium]